MYIFIMPCIAVDCFLEIYLNIKYSIFWSSKKTKIILFVGLAICCLLPIPFIEIMLNNVFHVEDITYCYIYPVFEIMFVIIFLCSYFYITRQVLIYRRNTRKLEKQLSRNSRFVHHKQSNNRFKLFLPTSIIVTFLVFMIGPNILQLCVSLKLLYHDVGYSVSFVFIPFGFIADPIVYIFNLKANRLAFARILPCNNFVHPTESLCL